MLADAAPDVLPCGRGLGLFLLGQRLGQRAAQPDDDEAQRGTEQERDPPAPLGHGVGADGEAGDEADQAGQQDAEVDVEAHQPGGAALAALGRELDRVGGRQRRLDAGGGALEQAADQQDDAGPDADARRRWAAAR